MNMSIAVLSSLLIASVALPKSASIIDVPSERRDSGISIGNVKVLFTGGHTEMWTKLGRAEIPKVAKSGLVGWITFTERNDLGWAVTNTLRVCWPPDGNHKDFTTEAFPFIENWDFADNETTVIIKSRGSHGPAEFLKYRLADGKVLGEAYGGPGHELPAWAKPYKDH